MDTTLRSPDPRPPARPRAALGALARLSRSAGRRAGCGRTSTPTCWAQRRSVPCAPGTPVARPRPKPDGPRRSASASSDATRPTTRTGCGASTPPRPSSGSAGRSFPPKAGRRWRSSAPGPRPGSGSPSRGRSPGTSPPPGSRSSRVSRAASTPWPTGAPSTRRGRTVAVLGSGLDRLYPAENDGLARAIEGDGAVVSEFPLGTAPWKGNFPRRNRVIAGWARATVVVEAGARSGALSTARAALDEGRDVMAVPGHPSQPAAEGTNALLRDGAALVRGAARRPRRARPRRPRGRDGGSRRRPPRALSPAACPRASTRSRPAAASPCRSSSRGSPSSSSTARSCACPARSS